jgi:hypothetical protein
MRISRDKLNKLAHTVADTLAETDQVGFLEDRNTIRQEARKILETLLSEEAKIDAQARQKIATQRKIILEGSQEWEILYRKYYNEEVRQSGFPCIEGSSQVRRGGRARLNAPDSKSGIVERLSGVRIPPSPPLTLPRTSQNVRS